jgi:hypothetical protein
MVASSSSIILSFLGLSVFIGTIIAGKSTHTLVPGAHKRGRVWRLRLPPAFLGALTLKRERCEESVPVSSFRR